MTLTFCLSLSISLAKDFKSGAADTWEKNKIKGFSNFRLKKWKKEDTLAHIAGVKTKNKQISRLAKEWWWGWKSLSGADVVVGMRNSRYGSVMTDVELKEVEFDKNHEGELVREKNTTSGILELLSLRGSYENR